MAYTQVKTPIIYYGGKTSIVNHLLDMVPVHEVYTETFFGGGTLFWAKEPAKNETINDRLDIVINFYRILKCSYGPLKKLVNATLISRSIANEALDVIRKYKQVGMANTNRVQLAWAFWVKTNFSHMNKLNGGYKQEKDGGRSIAQSLQNRKDLFTEMLVARIENATIENTDYSIVLNARNSLKAFHYFIPTLIMVPMAISATSGHGTITNNFCSGVLLSAMESFCSAVTTIQCWMVTRRFTIGIRKKFHIC